MKACRIHILTVLFLLAPPTLSQPQPSTAPPVPDHWWQKSPYTAQDSLNRTLMHVEGSVSYQNSTGNYVTHMLQTGGGIDIRKEFVTSSLYVTYRNQSTTNGNQETYMEEFLLSGHIDWDFHPYLMTQAGVLWQKDELHMIRDRYLPYLGVGTRWSIDPMNQLNVFIAGGRAFPTYTIPIQYFGLSDGPYNGIYAYQYYRISFSQQISLEESFLHIRNMNETKRYNTEISLKLSFALSPYLKLMMEYSRSLSTEAGFVGAKGIDTRQAVGFNFSI